jgi:hypothetical protein
MSAGGTHGCWTGAMRTSENTPSTRPRVYGLHLLATHTGSFSVVILFILFFVLFFAGNAGRYEQGSHCNSTHPEHPPQKFPSTQLFARHESTPLTMRALTDSPSFTFSRHRRRGRRLGHYHPSRLGHRPGRLDRRARRRPGRHHDHRLDRRPGRRPDRPDRRRLDR